MTHDSIDGHNPISMHRACPPAMTCSPDVPGKLHLPPLHPCRGLLQRTPGQAVAQHLGECLSWWSSAVLGHNAANDFGQRAAVLAGVRVPLQRGRHPRARRCPGEAIRARQAQGFPRCAADQAAGTHAWSETQPGTERPIVRRYPPHGLFFQTGPHQITLQRKQPLLDSRNVHLTQCSPPTVVYVCRA